MQLHKLRSKCSEFKSITNRKFLLYLIFLLNAAISTLFLSSCFVQSINSVSAWLINLYLRLFMRWDSNFSDEDWGNTVEFFLPLFTFLWPFAFQTPALLLTKLTLAFPLSISHSASSPTSTFFYDLQSVPSPSPLPSLLWALTGSFFACVHTRVRVFLSWIQQLN